MSERAGNADLSDPIKPFVFCERYASLNQQREDTDNICRTDTDDICSKDLQNRYGKDICRKENENIHLTNAEDIQKDREGNEVRKEL